MSTDHFTTNHQSPSWPWPSSTVTPATDDTPEEAIPRGTVYSRIRRLQGLAHPDPARPKSPISVRERDNTHSGWGRRPDAQARFAYPATHRRSETVEQKHLRPSASAGHLLTGTYARVQSSSRDVLDFIDGSSSDRDDTSTIARGQKDAKAQRPVAQYAQQRLPQRPRPRPLRRVPARSNISHLSQHESFLSASTDPRQAAREMFAQYGISRPAGWLSDDEGNGDLSKQGDGMPSPARYWRVCHICGAKIKSRTFCSSCGHPLCRTCTCAVPPSSDEAQQAFIAPKPAHLATPKPRSPVSSPLTQKPEREASQPRSPALKRSETAKAVRNNPFVIADRTGKASAAEPQTTTMSIPASRHPRPSDCVPRQEDFHVNSEARWHMECGNPSCRATHEGHHPYRHSLGCRVYNETRRARSDELADESDNELEPFLHLDTGYEQPPPVTTTQATIKKAYHRAEDIHRAEHIMEHLVAASTGQNIREDHQGVSSASHHEDLLAASSATHRAGIKERNIYHAKSQPEELPGKRDSPRGIPRARLSSPPPWLKDPTSKAGSIDGRLKRVEIKSTPNLSRVLDEEAIGARNVPERDFRSRLRHHSPEHQPSSPEGRKRDVTPPARAAAKTLRRTTEDIRHEKGPKRAETCTFCNPESPSPPARMKAAHAGHSEGQPDDGRERAEGTPSRQFRREETGLMTMEPYKRVRTLAEEINSPASRAAIRAEKDEEESREVQEIRVTSGDRVATEFPPLAVVSRDVELRHPVPVMPPNHHCSWETQYVDLAAEVRQLKAEISTRQLVASHEGEKSPRGGGRGGRTAMGLEIGVQADEDDVGLEGLTIVLHRKGRDDLVINTDLTGEGT